MKSNKTNRTSLNKQIKSKLLIFQNLHPAEKEKLAVDLYKLCLKVFDNITYEEFCHFVTRSGAHKTYIMIYRNHVGDIVGFFALHLFYVEVGGKKILIFRGQNGLLQEYRRSKANMYFVLFLVLLYRLRNPLSSVYCFLSVISPSMYAVLAKCVVLTTPRYNLETSEPDLILIDKLRKVFGFEKSEVENPWTTNVKWTSQLSESEINYWNKSDNPHIKYYLKLNPHFNQGIGLLMLIPFSWKSISLSSFNVFSYIVKKIFK